MSFCIICDVEGPCALNDNSEESMVALAESCGLRERVGIEFYKRISVIDDIWGDYRKIEKDPTYSSGHTLKVVLPFYKAMGATVQWLYEFAKQSLRVMPNIDKVLVGLNEKYNVWLISTSYDFFIRAFCDKVGFAFSRTYCTRVDKFDEISISKTETELLLDFMKEVSQMPVIEYDGKTGEVKKEHQVYYDRITNFIWETVYNLPVGEFLRQIHPVGQAQKLEAMKEVCQRFNVPLEKTMYVGDSQTDVGCVRYLRTRGLSLMFNGKGRVCSMADIMNIGENARAIEEVADLFAEKGRRAVIDYYRLARTGESGMLAAVTPGNIEFLEKLSVEKRKELRGVHIGELT